MKKTGIMLPQDKGLEVESHGRTYVKDGFFSEPFLTATFYNLSRSTGSTIDMDGEVPLPLNLPVTFDCKTQGQNISNIQIRLGGATDIVVVFWTQYSNFRWNP